MSALESEGVVTKYGMLNCQVCVPQEWTDEQVESFANSANPAGTQHGWKIQKEGHEALAGADERVQCASLPERQHVMLEC